VWSRFFTRPIWYACMACAIRGFVMAGRGRSRKTSVGDGANGGTKGAKANGNGGNLGFEAEMFKAADKLRGNMEPSAWRSASCS
jgi:hypothetical protein